MTRAHRFWAGAGAVVAALLFAPAPGASADPIGACTTTTGTVVAVDFAHWNGPIVRGCGSNASNGVTLLAAAGFTSLGDRHDGPAFICRLGNAAFAGGTQYPTPAEDACVVTPPSTAYWSFWIAPVGQNTWSYSQHGAAGDVPKPGEVEAWVFGGTDIGGTHGGPPFSPASVRAENPQPTGVAPPPAPKTSAPSVVHPSSPPATTAPKSPAPSSPIAADPIGTSSSSAVVSPVETGGATRGTAPAVVNAQLASDPRRSDGSVVPLLVGSGLIVLLGGAATATVLRRRRTP